MRLRRRGARFAFEVAAWIARTAILVALVGGLIFSVLVIFVVVAGLTLGSGSWYGTFG